MCYLAIKCDRCDKAIIAMRYKLKRVDKAIKKLEAHRNETYNLLLGEKQGIEWAIEQLQKKRCIRIEENGQTTESQVY